MIYTYTYTSICNNLCCLDPSAGLPESASEHCSAPAKLKIQNTKYE